MVLPKELYDSIRKLNQNLEKILESETIEVTEEELKSDLYLLEKLRAEIYDGIRTINREYQILHENLPHAHKI